MTPEDRHPAADLDGGPYRSAPVARPMVEAVVAGLADRLDAGVQSKHADGRGRLPAAALTLDQVRAALACALPDYHSSSPKHARPKDSRLHGRLSLRFGGTPFLRP